MKKFFVVTVVLIVSVFVFVGCGFSENAKYESQGKKNALQYVKEKYGFKPSVESVKSLSHNGSPIPFSSSSTTGYVEVEMKHDDKKFYVYISGLSENTDGIDNYQADLIEDKMKEEIKKLLPDVIQIDTSFGSRYSLSGEWDFGMVSSYFDGNNLSEVLESSHINRAVITLSDSSIDSITDEVVNTIFGQNAEYYFINYRSSDDLKKCRNIIYDINNDSFGYDIAQNAIYIKEYKRTSNNNFSELQTTTYNLGTYGDLIYTYEDGTYCDVTVLSDNELNKLGVGPDAKQKCIGNFYSIKTDADNMVFYVPSNLFADMKTEDVQFYELNEKVDGGYYAHSITSFTLDDARYVGGTISKYKKDNVMIFFGR